MIDANKHYLAVEKVVEHEDGSATYTFDMSNETKDMFVNDGIRFVLTCAAAKLDIEYALEILMNYKDDPDVHD